MGPTVNPNMKSDIPSLPTTLATPYISETSSTAAAKMAESNAAVNDERVRMEVR